RIVLIEAGPHVLNTFNERLRERAAESLARLGVEVRTGTTVTSVDEHGVTYAQTAGVPAARSHNDAQGRIDTHTVLWAAGVAASPIAKSLGVPLDRAGRVIADPTLAVPGHPDVFVAGDMCSLVQNGHPLPGVAQVAKQQGAHAARNIVRA